MYQRCLKRCLQCVSDFLSLCCLLRKVWFSCYFSWTYSQWLYICFYCYSPMYQIGFSLYFSISSLYFSKDSMILWFHFPSFPEWNHSFNAFSPLPWSYEQPLTENSEISATRTFSFLNGTHIIFPTFFFPFNTGLHFIAVKILEKRGLRQLWVSRKGWDCISFFFLFFFWEERKETLEERYYSQKMYEELHLWK